MTTESLFAVGSTIATLPEWAAMARFALSAVACVLLAWSMFAVRGTTLVAAHVWMVIALVVQVWAGQSGSMAAQLVGATATFCPAMAILGAKRPQNLAWQVVVLSLWLILALPAIQYVLLRGNGLETHGVWQGFYAVLIVVAAANHLPTRYGLAALLLAAAQVLLLWPHLPWLPPIDNSFRLSLGSLLVPVAVIVAMLSAALPIGRHKNILGWNRVWRDFRNAYGVVWALRAMERAKAVGQSTGSPVQLDWFGFHYFAPPPPQWGQPPAEPVRTPIDRLPAPLEQGMRGLLWRFVPAEWIEERLR